MCIFNFFIYVKLLNHLRNNNIVRWIKEIPRNNYVGIWEIVDTKITWFLVSDKEEAYKKFHDIHGRFHGIFIEYFHRTRLRSEIMRQVVECNACNVARCLNLSYDLA